ncbi:MAG: hypothetical protein GX640_21675, partial [Fibrobacter sp.]|nr:hypothetical protein [Fibrobacter sp.]
MIKQLQLKEFGDLLSLFIEVFDSFLASYDKKGCTHKNKEIVSHRFTFSISG